jgi:hypothetical protein
MNLFYNQPELTHWANDNDALIPELWAMAALRTLMSNMVMGALVNRDYSPMVANFGDIVNTSRPADFVGKRKTDADNVEIQDAVSPNIPVPLDQHLHVTFVIKDGERSKAMPDLVGRYLEPAARELAEKVDQILAGQVVRLTSSEEGRLGEMDKTNAPDFLLDANTALHINRAPRQGRNLVLGPRAEKATLGAELFVSTEKRGDGGTALREASLGRVYNMDAFMDQNVPYVALGDADVSTGVTTGAEAAGSTLIETDVTYADLLNTGGEYVVFGGEGKPYRIASVADNAGDANITLVEGLRDPVASGASVTVYLSGEVLATGAQLADYAKYVVVDSHTANKGPQKGQWITFGTGASSHSYTVIDVIENTTTESQVLLDRPLEAAIANNEVVFYGPAGGFNLAFHRDAVAMVSRPLATVPEGEGARSFVADFEGVAMRVTMQYDWEQQGTVVTFDLLMGVAVLDDRLAIAVYS